MILYSMRNLITLCLTSVAYFSMAQMVSIKERPSFYLGQRGSIGISMMAMPSFNPMFAQEERETSESFRTHLATKVDYTFALTNKWAAKVVLGAHTKSRESESGYSINKKHPDGTSSSLGFNEIGAEYLEDDIPHIAMIKNS